MIADAAHSFTDILSDIVTLWYSFSSPFTFLFSHFTPRKYLCICRSVKLSSKPVDENHPYGHGKFDSIGFVPTFWSTKIVF